MFEVSGTITAAVRQQQQQQPPALCKSSGGSRGPAEIAAADGALWQLRLGTFAAMAGSEQLRLLLAGTAEDSLVEALQDRCGQAARGEGLIIIEHTGHRVKYT